MSDEFFQRNWLFEDRRTTFGEAGHLVSCRFDEDNGRVPQLKHVRNYVEHWHALSERGLGLLLWGAPGSGKTFAAACIANAFLESRDMFAPRVVMTAFGVIFRRSMACSPQQREEYMAGLLDCGLLTLDDFGVERHTEFAQEQMYHIINGRYNRKKPMVITTNMTLQQMKNPGSVAEQRLHDRILEVCVPVCFDADSLRREKAAENLQFFRQLSETVAS